MSDKHSFNLMIHLRFLVARFAMWFCGTPVLYWSAPNEWEEYMSVGNPYVEEDDREYFITEGGRCMSCGHALDLDEPDFVVEESGVQPGTLDGPAVHWATGYIVCPNCGVQLPYETSS